MGEDAEKLETLQSALENVDTVATILYVLDNDRPRERDDAFEDAFIDSLDADAILRGITAMAEAFADFFLKTRQTKKAIAWQATAKMASDLEKETEVVTTGANVVKREVEKMQDNVLNKFGDLSSK